MMDQNGIKPPEGYPFPEDEVIYSSHYNNFNPQSDSYILVARLPEQHTVEINGKTHNNTHRLVLYTPIQGVESFLINPEADTHGLLSAVLNIMAESDVGGKGVASAHVPFYEKKSGVEIDFSRE